MTLSFNIDRNAIQRTLKTKKRFVPIGTTSKTILTIIYLKHYTLKPEMSGWDMDCFALLGLEHGSKL